MEGCTINDFSAEGIRTNPSASGSRLYISHGIVRHCGHGIIVNSQFGSAATIDSTLIDGCTGGVEIIATPVAIRDSAIVGIGAGGGAGVSAEIGAQVGVEDTLSALNGYAFTASSSSTIILARCAATANNYGIAAYQGEGGGTKIYVSESTIDANGIGLLYTGDSVISSRGNNTLQANTTNGTFTTTYAAQ